jgi:AcrR family transcriptional regulator
MGNAGISKTEFRLAAEQLERLDRARVLDALVAAVAEQGYATTSVADVLVRGGLSRRTFYRLFDSKADAFFAAYDALLDRAIRRVRAACGADGEAGRAAPPAVRLHAGLAVLVALIECHPVSARVCIVESPAASVLAGDGDRYLRPIVAWVEGVRAELGLDPGIAAAEQAAVLLGVLRARLTAGAAGTGDLVERLSYLTAGAVPTDVPAGPPLEPDTPLHGAIRDALDPPDVDALTALVVDAVVDHDTVALQRIARGITQAAKADGDALPDELRLLRRLARAGRHGGAAEVLRMIRRGGAGAGVDLPALRCLRYLAQNPGASGAEIHRGVADLTEAQVSRRLAHLERAGWVLEEGAGGRSKRWHATPAGRAALEG